MFGIYQLTRSALFAINNNTPKKINIRTYFVNTFLTFRQKLLDYFEWIVLLGAWWNVCVLLQFKLIIIQRNCLRFLSNLFVSVLKNSHQLFSMLLNEFQRFLLSCRKWFRYKKVRPIHELFYNLIKSDECWLCLPNWSFWITQIHNILFSPQLFSEIFIKLLFINWIILIN